MAGSNQYLVVEISVGEYAVTLESISSDKYSYTLLHDGKVIPNSWASTYPGMPFSIPGFPFFGGAHWAGVIYVTDASLPNAPTTLHSAYGYSMRGSLGITIEESDLPLISTLSRGGANLTINGTLPLNANDFTTLYPVYEAFYTGIPTTIENFPTGSFLISQFGSEPTIPNYNKADLTYDTRYWVPVGISHIFTDGNDTVDFNRGITNPTLHQGLAWNNARIDGIQASDYDAGEGDDVVFLPNTTTQELLRWNPAEVFRLGAGDDAITGGDGLDLIDGGIGFDVATFDVPRNGVEWVYIGTSEAGQNSYIIGQLNADNSLGSSPIFGIDILAGIEGLQFQDDLYPLFFKWGRDAKAGTPGGEVTWQLIPSYDKQPHSNFETATALTQMQIDFAENALRTAFVNWQNEANITFVKAQPNQDAMIKIYFGLPLTEAHGTAFYPVYDDFSEEIHGNTASVSYASGAGSITLDYAFLSEMNAPRLIKLATHEIGHAIGLRHVDTGLASIMAPGFDSSPDTLQAIDISQIQYLYGPSNIQTHIGRAINGYLDGATVYGDTNSNLAADDGEERALTDASGQFELNRTSAVLIAIGGLDTTTGLPFLGQFRAPAGSAVITPLTSLLVSLTEQGVGDPADTLNSALDLEGFPVTLTDPLLAAKVGTAGPFVAGVKVYNTISQLSVFAAGISAMPLAAAAQATFDALAGKIASLAPGQLLDLSDAGTVRELVESSLPAATALPPETLSYLAIIVTALNQALDEAREGKDGSELLASIAAVKKLAQGALSSALFAAAGEGTSLQAVADAHTGANLLAAIASARTGLGDVDGPNEQNPPVAIDDSFLTGAKAVLTGSSVLANDTDIDDDALIVSAVDDSTANVGVQVTLPSGAFLTVEPDGTFSYDPNGAFDSLGDGETAADSFTYTISDGQGYSSTATATITVEGIGEASANQAPVAFDSAAVIDEDNVLEGTLVATDADLDPLTFAISSGPTHGTVQLDSSTYRYAPFADFNGSDSFTFIASDGSLNSGPAKVTIIIKPVDDPSIIGGALAASVTEDGALTASGQITIVDPDVGEAAFRAGSFAGAYGSLILTATGAWTYTLNNSLAAVQVLNTGETLTDSLQVLSVDGTASSIAITVHGADEPPPPSNVITGTKKAEKIIGTVHDDVIVPLAGNDKVYAKGGNDVIIATVGDGNDIYDGGDGIDTVDYSALNKGASVYLGSHGHGYARSKDAGGDRLVSIENVIGSQGADKIIGSKAANKLVGGAGSDKIYGWSGNDIIEGGAGNDKLTGGQGSDAFVFKPDFGRDTIADFDASSQGGQDFILLEGFAVTADNFADYVKIADVGKHTLLTIDGDLNQTILLSGVRDATSITVDDFRFA